jgi:hypothetical protein
LRPAQAKVSKNLSQNKNLELVARGRGKRIARPGKKLETLSEKQTKVKRGSWRHGSSGSVLPSKYKALKSNPSTERKKRKRERGRERERENSSTDIKRYKNSQ